MTPTGQSCSFTTIICVMLNLSIFSRARTASVPCDTVFGVTVIAIPAVVAETSRVLCRSRLRSPSVMIPSSEPSFLTTHVQPSRFVVISMIASTSGTSAVNPGDALPTRHEFVHFQQKPLPECSTRMIPGEFFLAELPLVQQGNRQSIPQHESDCGGRRWGEIMRACFFMH